MGKLTKESEKQSHLKHGNATNTQKTTSVMSVVGLDINLIIFSMLM